MTANQLSHIVFCFLICAGMLVYDYHKCLTIYHVLPAFWLAPGKLMYDHQKLMAINRGFLLSDWRRPGLYVGGGVMGAWVCGHYNMSTVWVFFLLCMVLGCYGLRYVPVHGAGLLRAQVWYLAGGGGGWRYYSHFSKRCS